MAEIVTRTGKGETILVQYLNYHRVYTEKYGEKTVVLCQVGDFFELYAVINEQEERGPNIYRLAELLGIQVTRRNKSNTEVNDANYLMSGFPLPGIQKHIQTLIANCYTVVVVRQVTPPPNVTREVTEIISPSMTLTPTTTDSNYIIVIAIQHVANRWSCGVAAADVSTGASIMCEPISTIEDPAYALDELVRVLHTYSTREIVLLGRDLTEGQKSYVMETLGIGHRTGGIHMVWDGYNSSFDKASYQEAILSKAGIGRGILSAHIVSGMDGMPLASLAISYLVQFAYEHNPSLVKRMQQPRQILEKGRLTLQHNSAVQLNILGTGAGLQNETPLISILNRTVTPFGCRLFRDRLLNPITSVEVLNERYREVASYIEGGLYQKVRKFLTGILDIERIVRRMTAETYNPCDWPSLHMSLLSALSVAELLGRQDLVKDIQVVTGAYTDTIELDEAAKYLLGDIRGNIFRSGMYEELDVLASTISSQLEIITDTARELSDGGGDATLCKVDCNERDGFFLSTTKKRWDTIKAKHPAEKTRGYHTKPISHTSNTLRVTSPEIDTASDTIVISQAKIASATQARYIAFLRRFTEQHSTTMLSIARELACIDVYSTNAMNAHDFGYCCPEITASSGSFVYALHMRHPIIERIQQKVDYVANDVSLGNGSPGMLLYGINASGKSSLMKAIGISIIMAQSGMYVPCTSMIFSPYSSLFTRISGNDNIYQGMSSFAVEMTELKNILIRADSSSLVLGDELCSGTEAVSAISIVASGIDMLIRKQVSFVFATHLHEMLRIPELKSYITTRRLIVTHMHTEIIDGKIVYDRTLREGQGADTYGIEVCRGLGLPKEFMLLSEKIRRYMKDESDSFVSPKLSRYNHEVRMDMCSVCNVVRATETHHIRYQEHADENGRVEKGQIHKNSMNNLAPLCSSCHAREHRGSLKIHGWKQTSSGVELVYTEFKEQDKPVNKEDDETGNKIARDMDELAAIWRPYLRYTRNSWMARSKAAATSKFKTVKAEKLDEVLRKIKSVPSVLFPTEHDLEQLQTLLLDTTL